MKKMIVRIDVKVGVNWDEVEEISQIRKMVDKVEDVVKEFGIFEDFGVEFVEVGEIE